MQSDEVCKMVWDAVQNERSGAGRVNDHGRDLKCGSAR
jgi:hypothetical protein